MLEFTPFINAQDMPSRLEQIVELLHASSDAALASHSASIPGYPFATALAFVPDQHHRPVFLISRLAEHTQNIAADARASLMVRKPSASANFARATLVGSVVPVDGDPLLVRRYLRYQPEAEQFLAIGDFRFFRLVPQRIRLIGGFGQAGWLEGKGLLDAPALSLEEEADVLAAVAEKLPADISLLGIDAYGFDYLRGQGRERASFSAGPVLAASIAATLSRKLSRLS